MSIAKYIEVSRIMQVNISEDEFSSQIENVCNQKLSNCRGKNIEIEGNTFKLDFSTAFNHREIFIGFETNDNKFMVDIAYGSKRKMLSYVRGFFIWIILMLFVIPIGSFWLALIFGVIYYAIKYFLFDWDRFAKKLCHQMMNEIEMNVKFYS